MVAVPGGHRADPGTPPFPGGIAVSHLKVYDSVSVDGLAGGTPHCHTACTEAYAVIRGRGRVMAVSGRGYEEVPLEAGAFVWFTPGTIHRLVNDSGDLEILVIMANAGLPEAGDMVITFSDDVLRDPARYRALAVLPAEATLTDAADAAVRTRKDLAVSGMDELVRGGPDALELFHQRAAALVRPLVGGWHPLWQAGPLAAAQATGVHLAALAAGDGHHLAEASIHGLAPPPEVRRYGCCGALGVVQPATG